MYNLNGGQLVTPSLDSFLKPCDQPLQLETRRTDVGSFLSEAEQLQKSDSEVQTGLYDKLGLRNNLIEENARKDEKATDEYVKVIFVDFSIGKELFF